MCNGNSYEVVGISLFHNTIYYIIPRKLLRNKLFRSFLFGKFIEFGVIQMTDEFYMNFALQLAKVTEGQTNPNPVVGAVIVKNQEIVGFGAHLKAGTPHAEVNALQMAGERANGSTVYVTLEPCSHYGRTPPCAHALVKASVKRVVIASLDPNPIVAGKGVTILKNAGIEVTTGILEDKANQLNEAFFHFIQNEVPYVTLKQAITLDGKLATENNGREAITGLEVQYDVHRDRESNDAILVGIGTILADNPSLTNRLGNTKKQPIRVILDTSLNMPDNAKVVTEDITDTLIFVGSEVSEEKVKSFSQEHVEIIQIEKPTISIKEVLKELGKRNIMKLYVEGGSKVNASFLKSGYVNQLITYIAPKIIGGNNAVNMIGDINIHHIKDAYPLKFKNVEMIGEDIKITSVPK